ncbi:hypothetical protein ACJX0J_031068, partial [Zea mays]
GGKTVPSNQRIMQWQVCRKKQNKLEFLMPWWDLQLGVSVNQFLSIFASKNSDFRSTRESKKIAKKLKEAKGLSKQEEQ